MSQSCRWSFQTHTETCPRTRTHTHHWMAKCIPPGLGSSVPQQFQGHSHCFSRKNGEFHMFPVLLCQRSAASISKWHYLGGQPSSVSIRDQAWATNKQKPQNGRMEVTYIAPKSPHRVVPIYLAITFHVVLSSFASPGLICHALTAWVLQPTQEVTTHEVTEAINVKVKSEQKPVNKKLENHSTPDTNDSNDWTCGCEYVCVCMFVSFELKKCNLPPLWYQGSVKHNHLAVRKGLWNSWLMPTCGL